jgi:hypothetical protein
VPNTGESGGGSTGSPKENPGDRNIADVELLIAQLHHLVDAGGQIIATGTPAR